MTTSTMATQEEMMAARLPLQWRDQCSALLIPLNKCRHRHNYAPWQCEHERHIYHKCQYDDYIRRMNLLTRQKEREAQAKAAEAAAASTPSPTS